MSMVRNVKQARNGDILIASYLGVFRYDGTSFTNLTSKISSPASPASGMFWKIEKEIFGSLPRIQVFIVTMGNPFSILQPRMGLPVIRRLHIYEDRAGNIWFGASRYDGKSFRNFTTKDGFPSNSIRSTPGRQNRQAYGLVHKEKICSFMMEKHLPF